MRDSQDWKSSISFRTFAVPRDGERCHRWQQVQGREQSGQELHAGEGGTRGQARFHRLVFPLWCCLSRTLAVIQSKTTSSMV
jgi:hypothetical protein